MTTANIDTAQQGKLWRRRQLIWDLEEGNALKRWGPRCMEWFSRRTRIEIGPGIKCPAGYYERSRREKREGGQGMPDQGAQTIFSSY